MRNTACLLALAAAVLACLSLPSCLDNMFLRREHAAQEQLLRDRGREVMERTARQNAGRPFAEWSETDREVYRNARRAAGLPESIPP